MKPNLCPLQHTERIAGIPICSIPSLATSSFQVFCHSRASIWSQSVSVRNEIFIELAQCIWWWYIYIYIYIGIIQQKWLDVCMSFWLIWGYHFLGVFPLTWNWPFDMTDISSKNVNWVPPTHPTPHITPLPPSPFTHTSHTPTPQPPHPTPHTPSGK